MSRTVIVTGMSGAGRTTCLKILEDLGYEAVDNLPIRLIGRLLRIEELEPYNIAIGIDSRTMGFEPRRLVRHVRSVRERATGSFHLLFLDCDDDVLQRRFSTTRRRHPLADQLPMLEALAHERALLAPLKASADLVVDTSGLALPDLRRILTGHLGGAEGRLQVAVVSFSYKHGLPRDADLVFDVRFLRNPHYVDELKALTGQDETVQAYVRADPEFDSFMAHLQSLLAPLLPRYQSEGKSYLTIAIGCTGGQHRSVYLAQLLGHWLAAADWAVSVRHRDMPGVVETEA
jgi:UPF0042 nucleotide-binding protein